MTLPMWLDNDAQQEVTDAFYWRNGPCCAGCDWWARINSLVGECRKSAPVPEKQRWGMVGPDWQTYGGAGGAGHVMTPREHRCGDFKDEFDWSSLPLAYRVRIAAPTKEPKA